MNPTLRIKVIKHMLRAVNIWLLQHSVPVNHWCQCVYVVLVWRTICRWPPSSWSVSKLTLRVDIGSVTSLRARWMFFYRLQPSVLLRMWRCFHSFIRSSVILSPFFNYYVSYNHFMIAQASSRKPSSNCHCEILMPLQWPEGFICCSSSLCCSLWTFVCMLYIC